MGTEVEHANHDLIPCYAAGWRRPGPLHGVQHHFPHRDLLLDLRRDRGVRATGAEKVWGHHSPGLGSTRAAKGIEIRTQLKLSLTGIVSHGSNSC